MAVNVSADQNGRSTAVIYNGDTATVYDDKVRILVSNHYPKTFVDISKQTFIDILRKYMLDDEELKKLIVDTIKEEVIYGALTSSGGITTT